jgi:hypothetical protein
VGVFFNQVDCPLSVATIDALLTRFGRPDLMFAMYESQNLEFFESHSAQLPYETHRQNFKLLCLCFREWWRPVLLVSASAATIHG